MADEKKQSATDKERQDAHDNKGRGAVDGLGGMGGSSGAGGVRGKASEIGDISGIDPELDESEIPAPGSTGTMGPGQGRKGQMSDGGMAGKTRGPDSETVPNQTNPGSGSKE